MRRSFGPPPLDAEAHDGDAGLFGPGSASWQVIADAASIVGGIRSLVVQLTHPLAMAGVAQHSRYLEDPLGRLQNTSAYFALVTFGSTAEAVASTRLLGFKDDVSIHVQAQAGDASLVHMRSRSRLGRGDFGTNARRIRVFQGALAERVRHAQ